jgi:hypothetical protein
MARRASTGASPPSAYAIHSEETLINDFTHFLDDDVNGDQEQQDETRDVFGGDAALTLHFTFGGIQSDTTFGLQERHDNVWSIAAIPRRT